jgi:hypothetical protein
MSLSYTQKMEITKNGKQKNRKTKNFVHLKENDMAQKTNVVSV